MANVSQWFEHSFLPSVSHLLTTGPAVLFLEERGSHIDFEFVQTALKDCVCLHMQVCYAAAGCVLLWAFEAGFQDQGAMHATKVKFTALLKDVWENSLQVSRSSSKWLQMLWSFTPFQTGCIGQQADPGLKSDDKRKAKPTVYGQIMTSDVVIELLMGET